MKILGIDSGSGYIDAGSNILTVDGQSLKFTKDMVGSTISTGGGYGGTVTITEVLNDRQVKLSRPAETNGENSNVIVYGNDDRKHENDTITVRSVNELKNNTQPEKVNFTSAALDSAVWEPQDQTATINFKKGKSVEYKSLPRDIFEALVKSPSPGTYFNANIRGKFE